MVYQNCFSSTGGAVRGAEAKKNDFISEVKPCQTGPKFIYYMEKLEPISVVFVRVYVP